MPNYIPEAEECYEDYREALWLADEVQETALAALVAQIDARGEGRPLLVVNPHPWSQVAPVETAISVTQSGHDDWSGQCRPGAVDLVDDGGRSRTCSGTSPHAETSPGNTCGRT